MPRTSWSIRTHRATPRRLGWHCRAGECGGRRRLWYERTGACRNWLDEARGASAALRVTIGFGQDPGQAGKSQAQHLVRALSGFTVRPATESGDKLTRFGPFSSQCRASNVKIRRGSWNEELFRVLEGFPDLVHERRLLGIGFGAG